MTLEEAYKIIPAGTRIKTIAELMAYLKQLPANARVVSCCSSGEDCALRVSTRFGEDGTVKEFEEFFNGVCISY